MKNNVGIYGFYLNILSLAFLAVVVVDIVLQFLLILVTFGLIAFLTDSGSNPLAILSDAVNYLLFISFALTVISIPFLIVGTVQTKKLPNEYSGFRKTKVGIIIAVIIMVIFTVGFLYESIMPIVINNNYQNWAIGARKDPVSCDKNFCENITFSEADNILSFTLVGNLKNPVVFTELYSYGSCVNAKVEQFQTQDMPAPQIVEFGKNLEIPLKVNGKIKFKIKCESVKPNDIGRFGGTFGFLYKLNGLNGLSYGLNFTGPLLKN